MHFHGYRLSSHVFSVQFSLCIAFHLGQFLVETIHAKGMLEGFLADVVGALCFYRFLLLDRGGASDL